MNPDPRLDQIIALITELASGNLDAQLPHSEKLDDLDAVIVGLNMLAEELRASFKTQKMEERTRTLKESEERFRLLYEKTPMMSFAVDQKGDLLDVSDLWLEVMGYEREEVIGKNSIIFLTKRSQRVVLDSITPTFFKTGFIKNFPTQFLKKNGEVLDVEISAISDVNATGEIFRYLVIMVDVTERNRAEARLRQVHKMEALGTLAGGVAHDFNNILASMLINAEAGLLETPEDSVERSYLENILKAGERATDLVRQILTFSRMETTTLKPVNLSSVVQDALQIIKPTLSPKIKLHQTLLENCPNVLGDVTQLQQILYNLCHNASQAMEATGGTLEIVLVKSEETSLNLCVRDTGMGISPKDQERIFDPFFTTKRLEKGTGLGLSVVHSIVQQHHGKITVESEVDRGTTFSISFPITQESIIAEQATQSESFRISEDTPPQSNESPLGREPHLLIVDDEPVILRGYQTFLTKRGYKVSVCDTGSEALTLFQASPNEFDLILTDQSMPEMTGKQLSQTLLKIRPDLPILLSTGYSEDVSENNFQTMGISRYLPKPVKLAVLQEAIQECLKKD